MKKGCVAKEERKIESVEHILCAGALSFITFHYFTCLTREALTFLFLREENKLVIKFSNLFRPLA